MLGSQFCCCAAWVRAAPISQGFVGAIERPEQVQAGTSMLKIFGSITDLDRVRSTRLSRGVDQAQKTVRMAVPAALWSPGITFPGYD